MHTLSQFSNRTRIAYYSKKTQPIYNSTNAPKNWHHRWGPSGCMLGVYAQDAQDSHIRVIGIF